jgi:hypothetical protein
VFETQTQEPLACGNTARGLEGTQVLFRISDEIAWPAPDAAGAGIDGSLREVVALAHRND